MQGMTCTDQIDGEYTDKRRFLIFDYCAISSISGES